MKLVDEGLIGLDDPVNDVIPAFEAVLKPPGPITVRQLLGHTSGMPDYKQAMMAEADWSEELGQRLSLVRMLELAATPSWEPRSVGSFSYSDSNYAVLGLLLERFRGKPYSEIVTDSRPAALARRP